MVRDFTFSAGQADAGLRVEHAVARRVPSTCRSLVLSALGKGLVTVNGSAARKGLKLEAGDQVRLVELMETADRRALPDPSVTIALVYEDPFLLVVNKPAGMPVHPIEAAETGTLVNGLLARYPELGGIGGDLLFPAAVHRIDADTSGLVLVARTDEAHRALRAMFAGRLVRKDYSALVIGDVPGPMTLEDELVHSPKPSHRMRVVRREGRVRGAMRAVTECRPVERLQGFTLLDITIRTGVTHQIRCQLAHAGHPVAGDRIYGRAAPGYDGRLFLHACRLEFDHPWNGRVVSFEAALPPDLDAELASLRPGLHRHCD
jgi:23S rRNA pseudouridine1911/1915/1917 synthase